MSCLAYSRLSPTTSAELDHVFFQEKGWKVQPFSSPRKTKTWFADVCWIYSPFKVDFPSSTPPVFGVFPFRGSLTLCIRRDLSQWFHVTFGGDNCDNPIIFINQCLFIWGWHSSEWFSFDPGLRWRFLLTGVFIFAAVITVDVLILHMTKCSQRYKPACELVRLYFLHRCFHNCHDFFCKASRTRRVAINAWIGLEENFRLNLPFFVPETVGKPPIFPDKIIPICRAARTIWSAPGVLGGRMEMNLAAGRYLMRLIYLI